MYCVAEFIDTAETEVILTKWINEEETRCFWPHYKSTDRVKKAILSIEIPDVEKWNEYSTRILQKYETYQEARSHLSKAVYTSHLDSEEDNDECRPKRKRISKIYYSSSEESFVSKKQKQNKNKSKIRSPPIIRAPDKCTSDREDVTLNSVANSSRERNFTENRNFNSSVIPITSTNNNNNKYRINRQRISEIYSSSEESFVSKKQKQNKNRNKIRSSPIIRASDIYTSDREDVTLNSLAEISRVRNFTENENINSCIMSTTSMNNNKNTEPLELLILKKLKKLDYIQNNIIVPNMQEILTFLRPHKLEVFQETNVPTLPIDNDTQLNKFEQYLSTTENYKNMILKFSRVGGHGAAGMKNNEKSYNFKVCDEFQLERKSSKEAF